MGYYSSPRIKKIRNESQTANNTSIFTTPNAIRRKNANSYKTKSGLTNSIAKPLLLLTTYYFLPITYLLHQSSTFLLNLSFFI